MKNNNKKALKLTVDKEDEDGDGGTAAATVHG